jgi:hypothetical protein
MLGPYNALPWNGSIPTPVVAFKWVGCSSYPSHPRGASLHREASVFAQGPSQHANTEAMRPRRTGYSIVRYRDRRSRPGQFERATCRMWRWVISLVCPVSIRRLGASPEIDICRPTPRQLCEKCSGSGLEALLPILASGLCGITPPGAPVNLKLSICCRGGRDKALTRFVPSNSRQHLWPKQSKKHLAQE